LRVSLFPDGPINHYIYVQLDKLDQESAFDELIKLLEDNQDKESRASVISAIGATGSYRTTYFPIKCLKHELGDHALYAAVEALQKLGASEAIFDLNELLNPGKFPDSDLSSHVATEMLQIAPENVDIMETCLEYGFIE